MSQTPSGLAPASAEPARKDALEVIQDSSNDVVILEDEHAKRTANWCASQLRAVSRPGLLPPLRWLLAQLLLRMHDATVGAFLLVLRARALAACGTPNMHACRLDIAYHSVTAMIGAGVLGLPAALSHLGWAGGMVFMLFSFWVSWHTYKLLVYMHEVPDLDYKAGNGVRRLDRYDQLAEYVLGKRRGKMVLMPFQLGALVGIAITYTVVGGDNLAAFAASTSPSGPVMGNWAFYILFGALELLLSLVRERDDTAWGLACALQLVLHAVSDHIADRHCRCSHRHCCSALLPVACV